MDSPCSGLSLNHPVLSADPSYAYSWLSNPKSAPSVSTSFGNGGSWSHTGHDGRGAAGKERAAGTDKGRGPEGANEMEAAGKELRREEAPPRRVRVLLRAQYVLQG